MLGDERLQLADQLAMSTELDVSRDAFLYRQVPQTVEPEGLGAQRGNIRHVGQCRATPQVQSSPQPLRSDASPARAQRRSAFGQKPLEPVRVKPFGVDHQPVTRLHPYHDLRRRAPRQTWLEHFAQLAHIRLDHADGRHRRVVTPQTVHQTVDCDHLVRMNHEQRQHRPLLRAQRSNTHPVGSL